MTWFSRYLQRYSKLASNAPRLRLSDIKNVKHELDWPLLVTMYDLRMWFLQRSKAVGRKSQLLGSIENLHNDLNYLWARQLIKHTAIFFIVMKLYLAVLPEEETNVNWNHRHELKFQLQAYNELEDGGLEGEE